MDTVTAKGSTEAIVRDSWDRDAYDAALEQVPILSEASDVLAAANPRGAAAMADLHAAFLKGAPQREEAGRMRPDHVVNHALMGQALDAEALRDLRRYTVGNPVASAMACAAYAGAAAKLYPGLAPVQAQADEAQRSADALDEFLEANGDTDLDEDLQAALDQLSAEAADAEADLADGIGDAEATMGRLARSALAEAAADAEATASAMVGIGLAPGDTVRMDPASRLRLASRLSAQRMRDIAEKMGSLRTMALGARVSRTTRANDRRNGVTLGDNLARVLTSELAGLAVPALTFDFYDRWSRKQLLQHDVEGDETLGNGPIIYCGDFSGSMYSPDTKAQFCKAMGGSLLGVARHEGRPFYAIDFAGPRKCKLFAFPDPASFDPHAILDYFGHGFSNGGTCFETPLDLALQILEEEHAATGKVSADICLSTDGEAVVSDAWMARFKAAQARLEFHVFGMAIGAEVDAEPFATLCDRRVEKLHDLLTGKNVQALYRGIS